MYGVWPMAGNQLITAVVVIIIIIIVVKQLIFWKNKFTDLHELIF